MAKICIFLLVFSSTILGKTIHVDVNQGHLTTETVDPALKIWYLQHYIFREQGIDPQRYTLAIKTSSGFARAKPHDPIVKYGAYPESTAQLYVVEVVHDKEGEHLLFNDVSGIDAGTSDQYSHQPPEQHSPEPAKPPEPPAAPPSPTSSPPAPSAAPAKPAEAPKPAAAPPAKPAEDVKPKDLTGASAILTSVPKAPEPTNPAEAPKPAAAPPAKPVEDIKPKDLTGASAIFTTIPKTPEPAKPIEVAKPAEAPPASAPPPAKPVVEEVQHNNLIGASAIFTPAPKAPLPPPSPSITKDDEEGEDEPELEEIEEDVDGLLFDLLPSDSKPKAS
jgi:hypothetical protein